MARGDTAVLYRRGLYRFDTVFTTAGQHGTDHIVLLVVVPLLVWSLLRYRRGVKRRGAAAGRGPAGKRLHLRRPALGTLAYNLFLPYMAVLAASLVGFAVVFTSAAMRALGPSLAARMPRRALATSSSPAAWSYSWVG